MVFKIECQSRRKLGLSILLFKMCAVKNVCFPNMPEGILSHCSDLVTDSSTIVHSTLFMFLPQTMQKRKMLFGVIHESHRKRFVSLHCCWL